MYKRLLSIAGLGLIGFVSLFALTAQPVRADDPEGAQLFATYCAACHGETGKGGIAPAINTVKFLSAHDDEALTGAIQAGNPETGMPAWGRSKGGMLGDEQVGAIVAYLRSFAPAASSEATATVPTPAVNATPLPTAAPIKTTLIVAQSSNAAGEAILVATLTEDDGDPVGGAVVAFSRATSFGTVDLGTVKTDAKGNASLTLVTVPTNARQVVVAFKGDKGLMASETSLALAPGGPALVEAPSAESPGKVRLSVNAPLLLPEGSLITPNPPLLPTAIFALVVGCVWATYGYVASQVFGIWKSGRSRERSNILRR